MLDAWINAEVPVAMEVAGDRKMVPPVVMKSTTWGTPPTGNNAPACTIDSPAGNTSIDEGQSVSYAGSATDSDGTIASWSWTFAGGTPGSASVEEPSWSFDLYTAGVYTHDRITATDNGDSTATRSRPGTVQITVNCVSGVNNAPVANDDSYSVDQDTVLNIAASGVLGKTVMPMVTITAAVQLSRAANGIATL